MCLAESLLLMLGIIAGSYSCGRGERFAPAHNLSKSRLTLATERTYIGLGNSANFKRNNM
jgi:hypothetical protein